MSTRILVDSSQSVRDDYPVGCSPFFHYARSPSDYQEFFSNTQNFAPESKCDIFHMQDGKAEWKKDLNDAQMLQYLNDQTRDQTPIFRVIFCTSKDASEATHGSQLSLSKTAALDVINRFQMSPNYLIELMGGSKGYPANFASCNTGGVLNRIEFSYEYCSFEPSRVPSFRPVCMTHDPNTQSTTYVGTGANWAGRATSRLMDMSRSPLDGALPSPVCLLDPFMFHLICIDETLITADTGITETFQKLDNATRKVHEYSLQSQTQRTRDDLERLTIQLNNVSQDIDHIVFCQDITESSLRSIQDAHRRYAKSVAGNEKQNELMRTTDIINHLAIKYELDVFSLKNMKSRKDTAMNLIFNLVTQQDAATSTAIAREAKADGNSMKIIAALTMMFLPGTFLSSVFGMSSLEKAAWWLYVALAIPLTFVVVMIWWLWLNRSRLRAAASNFRRTSKDGREEDRAEGLSPSVRVPSFQSQNRMSIHELRNRGSLSSSVRPPSFQSQNRTSVHEVQNLPV